MAYEYVTIHGQRVQKTVADAFYQLAAAFKAVWGLDLLVSSGTRTTAEQKRLHDGWVRRLPGFNLALPPGHSNHEESGPRGPRALDVRDSGRDSGVTVRNTKRSNWLRDNAPKYGFTVAGLSFRPIEPWHIEYTGDLAASAPTPAPSPAPAQTHSTVSGPRMLRWYGIQCMLKKLYQYTGAIDNAPGGGTIAALQRFLKQYRNIAVDGIWGIETIKAIQTWLKAKWGYTGAIDGIIGGGTVSSWQRAETANWNAFK